MHRVSLSRALMTVALILPGLAALPARAEVSITPRVGYYFDNTSQRQSAVDYSSLESEEDLQLEEDFVELLGGDLAIGPYESARNSSQLAFPQFGATVTFTLPSSQATQFAFTALYGETSSEGTEIIQRLKAYSVLGLLIRDTEVTNVHTTADYTRLDLEATVQHRLNETFSLIGGVRAERIYVSGSDGYASVQSYHLYNAVNDQLGLGLPPNYQEAEPRNVETYHATSWTYSGRIGAAAFAPVGEKHLFYVNGLLQVSYHPANTVHFTNSSGSSQTEGNGAVFEEETSIGPDISVGYMYRASDRFGIDLRYRATVYFTVDGPSDFEDSRVNHGIGLGFTTWLGR
jgi:hypothetical protein